MVRWSVVGVIAAAAFGCSAPADEAGSELPAHPVDSGVSVETSNAEDSPIEPDAAGDDAGGEEVRADAGADGVSDAASPKTFVHPGILVQQGQLDLVRAKIKAGAAPWAAAFNAAKASRFASASYVPHPRAIVECGSYSTPDNGCSEEKDDSTAAYTQALLFTFSGDEKYAAKAVEIMNAWSAVLTDHTNSNAPLQSAWVGSVFPRAGELIRAGYSKWAATDAARFSKMLKTVYLPEVIKGSGANGNWELSMAEATIAIGVYLDDRPTFDTGVTMWRKRVPAYLYLASDGPLPVSPPGSTKTGSALTTYWYNPGKFVDGLCQETCRDFGHVQLGLSAMINAAETARIQGVDLYAEQADRIAKGLEWNAQWLDGVAPPSWLCGGTLTDAKPTHMWEIALNEYANRLGRSMPRTASLVTKVRPTGTNHQMIFETLTHASVGDAGL